MVLKFVIISKIFESLFFASLPTIIYTTSGNRFVSCVMARITIICPFRSSSRPTVMIIRLFCRRYFFDKIRGFPSGWKKYTINASVLSWTIFSRGTPHRSCILRVQGKFTVWNQFLCLRDDLLHEPRHHPGIAEAGEFLSHRRTRCILLETIFCRQVPQAPQRESGRSVISMILYFLCVIKCIKNI